MSVEDSHILTMKCSFNCYQGSKVYLRPQSLTPAGPVSYENTEELPTKIPVKDETKRLRFTHHRTAFDVDIDNLESHPWRNKNVDLSDYFNYGFSEATWQVHQHALTDIFPEL